MTKKLVVLALFLLGTSLIIVSHARAATHVTDRKIVIDAGHGGSDNGSMECPDYTEKVANLDIAERLKALLEANGATTYMTRVDDSTLSNNDRYTFANSTDGEVLVSVHLNGSTNHDKDGTQGLYGKRNKDKAFTEIIHSALWNSLKSTPDFIDFGVTNFASGVLLKSNMPATIQETVFISDTDECAWLTDGTGNRQQEIAQSLYDGLNDWFSQAGDGDNGNGGGRKCETPPCGKNK